MRMARPGLDWSGSILCLDPGETTGWALFEGIALADCGQWPTPEPQLLAENIQHLAEIYTLERIVYESYRIRGNKIREHIGSEVVTIQHIGAIKVVADERGIPTTAQTAGMAKGFATDTKLRRWGLYQSNHRHANDSIRHGVYWLLFYAGRKDPRIVR